jgi:hypothetical protein
MAQCARAAAVDSFEEIPHVLADLTQRSSKFGLILSELMSICQSKSEDELLAEARTVKQQSSFYQDLVRDISPILRVDSSKKYLRIIMDMKSQLNDFVSREKQLLAYLEVDSASKIVAKISRISQTNRVIKRIGSVLQTENQDAIVDQFSKFVDIERILNARLRIFTVQALSEFVDAHEDMEQRQARILRMLSLPSPADLEQRIESRLEDCRELNFLKETLNIRSSPRRIGDLVQADTICGELATMLGVQDVSRIVDMVTELLKANTEMNELEEQVMVQLSVLLPTDC